MLLEIIAPMILAVGLLGNIINLYVFTRPIFRTSSLSTFRFLAYLSLIDLLYLLIGLSHIMIIVYTGYDYRTYSSFVCSVHSFLTLYLSHLSSNVLAGVSVFRCVTLNRLKPVKPIYFNGNAVKIEQSENPKETYNVYRRSNKPLTQRIFSCFGQADAVVLVIMLILFLFDCHYLIWMRLSTIESYELKGNYTDKSDPFANDPKAYNKITYVACHPSETGQVFYYTFLRKTWIWIDLFLYSYVPFTVMIVCTVLIIYRLYKITKNLKGTTKKSSETTKHKDLSDPLLWKRNKKSFDNSNLLTIPTVQTQISNETNSIIIDKNKSNNNSKANSKGSTPKAYTEQFKKTARKNSQIYKLLLTVNLFFFVLVTPLVLSNSLDILGESDHIFRDLVYTLAYLNHALNFIFYGFSCKIYRMILIDFFKGLFKMELK
jgi:hypothetical protein